MHKPAIMQINSHNQSWIAIIRDAVEAWRKQNGWSRETVAQMIVDAHYTSGQDTVTGIVLDPHTRDTYERMKVNADRIFRWLDEVTKDRNLLPANFIPSILAALPHDLRTQAVNRMLMPVGLGCREVANDGEDKPLTLLQSMLVEASGAERAVAELVDGFDHAELVTAHKELSEALSAFSKARDTVENMMRGQR